MARSHFVYMLRCADGSYYVGMTNDVRRRVEEHQQGLLPGYTHSRRPIALAWSQEFPSRLEAYHWERHIKRWTRAKKEALAAGEWQRLKELARGPNEQDR